MPDSYEKDLRTPLNLPEISESAQTGEISERFRQNSDPVGRLLTVIRDHCHQAVLSKAENNLDILCLAQKLPSRAERIEQKITEIGEWFRDFIAKLPAKEDVLKQALKDTDELLESVARKQKS